MQLVEQHIINNKHSLFKEIDSLSFLSKNLYNKANYVIRQEFIRTFKEKEEGKLEHANYLNYYNIQKQLQNTNNFEYKQLPAKVSQQVLKVLDKNWLSFFKSIQEYKNNVNKYKGKPSLPKYKHKIRGRNLLIYTVQAISKKELKNNIVHLSGTNIKIKTIQKDIQQVRIIPKNKEYVIEIIYKKEVQDLKLNKKNVAGIDLGVNNLCAITSNLSGVRPLLINGRPLKSINQFYNKKKSKLQSYVGDKSSNRLIKLTNKRNRKVNNYLHNASRFIIKYLIRNDIGILVIGKKPIMEE
jgi:putative transposase